MVNRTLVTALMISTPLTVLLVGPLAHLGFGQLPGDLVINNTAVSVMIPLVSAAIVLLAVYGSLSLLRDARRS
jgi:hypothetical protein